MNVDLMRIAEKKLEQMGATVHGVLVKSEAGAWVAVSEAGRVMWLDGFEGRASSAQPEPSRISHASAYTFEDAWRDRMWPKPDMSDKEVGEHFWNLAIENSHSSAGAVPEPFILGNSYRTVAGDLVRFVKVHNEGSSYETMEDEAGVNRYTNRPGDMGRVTARPVDYPGNVRPLYTHNGEQGDGWIWVTKDHPGPHGGNWITYRPDAPKEAQVTTTWYDPNHNGWSGKYRVAAYMCRPKPPTEREDDA